MTETPDTSVLVPAPAAWHPHHRQARQALTSVQTVLAHVPVETFSVLTRLPAPHRIGARDAALALGALPWAPRGLSAQAHAELVGDAGDRGIAGGAIYDALIAAAARQHGLTLLTADARARRTYEALGVAYRVVAG